jgi:hypothetical protein
VGPARLRIPRIGRPSELAGEAPRVDRLLELAFEIERELRHTKRRRFMSAMAALALSVAAIPALIALGPPR